MTRLRPEDAERRRQSGDGPDFSEALARGLQIITAFSNETRQMTLSDVARAVNLPRATARRALHTLQRLGYVEVDDRMFRLTPRILRLASAYLTANAITCVVQPVCERIVQTVREICSVAVLDGDDVVTIARALPAQLAPVGIGVGYRLPAYCSSLGRVLLANLPEDALEAFLARTRLEAMTSFTITDPAALRKELRKVRSQGFSYADQESEYGYRSIAAPIRKFNGGVVAAIHIGARIERVSMETMLGALKDQLANEARELEYQLV